MKTSWRLLKVGVVRIGAFLLAGQFPGQDHAAVLERTVAAAVAAEDAGFDDVWIAEHHFMSYGVCPSAITCAAYVLGCTTRIEVGTAVSVLSTVHPVALGEQAALLDQLSGGRFRLGVGRGGPWVDLEVFGTGQSRIEGGFNASLDLLLRWLTGERVAADDGPFRFREVAVVPRPATRPRPPILLACTSDSSAQLAAQRALPMLLGMNVPDEDKAAMVARYAEASQAAGCDPGAAGHVGAMLAQVAESREEATAQLRESMPGWLGPGLAGFRPLGGEPRRYADPVAYADLLCSIGAVGSPEQCAARLSDARGRTGIDHMILMVDACGERELTMANIARLGAQVLPRLRGM